VTHRHLDPRWLVPALAAAAVTAVTLTLSLTVTTGAVVHQVLTATAWLFAIPVPVLAVRAGVDAGVHKQHA
jgi:hypothetical protein